MKLLQYYVKYSIIKKVTSNIDIAIWQGGFIMIILLSIAYFFVWAIIGFCVSYAMGIAEALYVAILMGTVAFFSSLCGYTIGKVKMKVIKQKAPYFRCFLH